MFYATEIIMSNMKITEQDGRAWSNELFGCFGDIRICILTFCVPCYTLGKNGEALGEDCLLVGLLACVGVNMGPVMRWRIRQEKGIKGSMIMDSVCWIFCGYCSLIQEARELGWDLPGAIAKAENATGTTAAVDRVQDMTRQ